MTGGPARPPRFWDGLFRLRLEEAAALAFILPTTYLTLAAYYYAKQAGNLGDRFPGGKYRIAVAILLLIGLGVGQWRWPHTAAVKALRETLPFVTCVLIYTNLHDTIGLVNPHDVHHTLAGLDKAIFGVIPCVWTEQFITRERTEVMQFFYVNFAWIAPSASLILLAQRRWPEFRAATLGVIVCFYAGYFLYVLFPAAPPRLVLVYDFKKTLTGYPNLFSNLSARAFELLPVDSRAAFPSLHTAVSLVVLFYAWKYLRFWFWVLVPLVLGLWASTIYLRHHYAVDLMAGWVLGPFAIWAAPKLDAWWARRQRARGYATARGVK